MSNHYFMFDWAFKKKFTVTRFYIYQMTFWAKPLKLRWRFWLNCSSKEFKTRACETRDYDEL